MIATTTGQLGTVPEPPHQFRQQGGFEGVELALLGVDGFDLGDQRVPVEGPLGPWNRAVVHGPDSTPEGPFPATE
jgi:hypothetical protein